MDQERMSREAAPTKPGYWAVLPAAVRYDPRIPASAKLLYAEISSLTDGCGFCWASNAYFERLYDLSERTIIRLIRALEAAGYIRIEDADGGAATRKIYAGVNPMDTSSTAGSPPSPQGEGLTPDKNVSTPLTKMSVPPDKNVTHIKKENKKENSPPKAPQGAGAEKKTRRRTRAKAACEYEPEIFERFWSAYPRGEGKAEARYEWDELRPDRKLMLEMSAALDRQKVSAEWLRDNGRAVPYACRWLSHRRWEDDPKENPATPQPPGGGSPGQGSHDAEEAGLWL